jgi:hypothetical protein
MLSMFLIFLAVVLNDLNIIQKGTAFAIIGISTIIGAVTGYYYMDELNDYNKKHKPPRF